MPLFAGLIPLGIGLAYLIYYFVEGRHVEARWLEHDSPSAPAAARQEADLPNATEKWGHSSIPLTKLTHAARSRNFARRAVSLVEPR